MRGRPTHPLVTALALLLCACASGSLGQDSGPGAPDTGARDAGRDAGLDAGALDGGPRDAGGDAGAACGGVVCEPFQYCDSGRCREYPACAGDGSCDRPGDVCHSRRCVPGTVDVDGDGSPAAEDCDETRADRFPGATEVCSDVDEDCDGTNDEGDPAALCASSADGGICIDHVCGCPAGTFDFDRAVPGCECVAAPAPDQGTACDAAIDLGSLGDTGAMISVNGNALPATREVWYRFRGLDAPDTTCDNYHVRAQLLTNPGDAFELTVFRGACTTPGCTDTGFVDYTWATDMRVTSGGRLTGQCPCTAPGAARVADRSVCEDDSADYFVRVRRRAGAAGGAVTCAGYVLEVSNGLYDTI